MERRPALAADLVIPVLALAFTLYFLHSVRELDWEAKANGVIIGTILLTLVGVQAVRLVLATARGNADRGFAPLLSPREVLPKRLGMLAVTIIFVAAVPYLGLALGLFAALLAALLVMGVRGAKRVFAVALGVAVVASLLFTVALDSGLPKGPVERFFIRLAR